MQGALQGGKDHQGRSKKFLNIIIMSIKGRHVESLKKLDELQQIIKQALGDQAPEVTLKHKTNKNIASTSL